MLCQNCKKNTATYYHKEVINGKASTYALCPECAAKLKSEGKLPDFSFDANPFSLFFDPSISEFMNNFMGISDNSTAVSKKLCPKCNSSWASIRQSGMAGCPYCFTFFSDSFAPLIQDIHGQATHVGRIPARFNKKKEKKAQIAQLKNELNEAIKNEEFEKAAQIRDQIKELEKSEKESA